MTKQQLARILATSISCTIETGDEPMVRIEGFEKAVDAILAQLREPDDNMKQAGLRVLPGRPIGHLEESTIVWQAMIDAIGEET